MNENAWVPSKGHHITMIGLVAALYVVLTFLLAPLSFGMGLRISEGLNYLGLYNRRHILGISLGVFLTNYFAYGLWDMVIGTLSTLVFVPLGVWLAKKWTPKVKGFLPKRLDPMLIEYAILTLVFSWSMFTIAGMVVFLGASDAFWPLYGSMVVVEALSMSLGGLIIYPLSRRLDLSK